MYDNEVSKNGFILWSRMLRLGYLKRYNGGVHFMIKILFFMNLKVYMVPHHFKSHSTKQGVITDSKNDLTFALL